MHFVSRKSNPKNDITRNALWFNLNKYREKFGANISHDDTQKASVLATRKILPEKNYFLPNIQLSEKLSSYMMLNKKNGTLVT